MPKARAFTLFVLSLVLAACSSAVPSASPTLIASSSSGATPSQTALASSTPSVSATPSASVTPAQATLSPTPLVSATLAPTPKPTLTPAPKSTATLYLRLGPMIAPIGPEVIFFTPTAVISDLYLYSAPASWPLLYASPVRRSITQSSLDLIIAAAQSYGLLTTTAPQNLLCPGTYPPGGDWGTTALEMTVNGVAYDLSGGCPSPDYVPSLFPQPGTYDAFVTFVAKLNDLVNWPGISLGSADPWAPANLLVIPGFATNDMSQAQTYRNWPLGSYVTFGVPWNPVDFPGDRCGITTPAQTALLLPIVQGAAAETTLFTDASGVSMGLGLRPILPGETMAGICP